jgi:hypothetical protein
MEDGVCIVTQIKQVIRFQKEIRKRSMSAKSNPDEHATSKQTDAEKQIYYKDIAGFLVFVAIVLIAYYVAVSIRQS